MGEWTGWRQTLSRGSAPTGALMHHYGLMGFSTDSSSFLQRHCHRALGLVPPDRA
jgi:hypothetical protein